MGTWKFRRIVSSMGITLLEKALRAEVKSSIRWLLTLMALHGYPEGRCDARFFQTKVMAIEMMELWEIFNFQFLSNPMGQTQ